ncbi:TPR repeat [Carex littledalei]|uniref:TPR repeat n=1 Tax=Carex littledalei TaxID=544730 RepID=A0A833QGD0_9POAL|nr:TPR repeat [Carex littledalei]
METLHRTKSSSSPDLLSLLSSSNEQPHKRTNSATDLASVIDVPAPLQSDPSFSIYANDPSSNDLNQKLDTIYRDFTFGSEYPDPTESTEKCDHNAVPLFLARGLGIDRLGSELLDVGELMKGKRPVSNGNGEENLVLDMELKRIVEEEPDNATALTDYAQFLHQNKGDAKRAEEYYSRAILADPTDGEIMAQYAKLVWYQHADVERSLSYFEKAVQLSPENSHVFAAYAGFLWEIGDDNEHGNQSNFQSEFSDQVVFQDEAPVLTT